MSKFGGFLARKPAYAVRRPPAEPAARHAATIRSNSTRNCSPPSAPSSAARTRRCATCCSTPTPRSASSTPSRTRSTELVDPVEQGAARERGREIGKGRRCRRCSTTPAPPTASCATRWPTWRRRQAVAQSECLMLRQELASTQNLLQDGGSDPRRDRHRRRRPPRPDRASWKAASRQESGEARALREENQRLDDRLHRRRQAHHRARIRPQQRAPAPADGRGRKARAAGLARQGASPKPRACRASWPRPRAASTPRKAGCATSRPISPRSTPSARGLPPRSTRPTSATSTSATASASASRRCRRAPRATEKLLGEAREHLLARAEEIRDYDRRIGEIGARARRPAGACRRAGGRALQRESELRGDRQSAHHAEGAQRRARARLHRQGVGARPARRRPIAALNERIARLEGEIARRASRPPKRRSRSSTAALRREKLERAMAEGALETARKDFARVMREVMALQRSQAAREPGPNPSPPTPPDAIKITEGDCRIAGPKARRCRFAGRRSPVPRLI